ncbi:MAG: phenylalanine--tRNA ligase subunit beta [Cellulomonas sp.]|nr:phenylalanine--tRNA ligase subunit beta [Cellulomonas sp.]
MVLVPLPWLGEHVALPAGLTAEQLAADLVKVGLEEEAVHTGGDVTGPVVVGRVLDRTPELQKNGKTINWCHVDVGTHNVLDDEGNPTVPRGIVCGAQNFEAGDWVVVTLPGAVLPGPFAISARKTYGHVSDGMICSSRELGIGDDHSGIIVLTRQGFASEDLVAGADALTLLGLGEQVLEINVTPDRGYCFAIRGVAREYALSTGAVFTDHGLPTPQQRLPVTGGFAVELADDAPIHGEPGCARFVAQIIRGVAANAASPAWMQRRLAQAGMRPLGLAVDVTNYVMLELGQPLHAYDLAALAEPIVVRRARVGERLVTLDGQDRALDAEDLLITDSPDGQRGARALGLAGVMGGKESETAEATTDLLVEAAWFDPVSIARTSRRHKLSSEAAKRFERGVDTALQRVAAARVVELLTRYGGGVADDALTDVDLTPAPPALELDLGLATRLVGVVYSPDEVREVLEAIGCQVGPGEGRALVTVPSWRPDLRTPEDLVEEVARVRGYDQIPSVVPRAAPGSGLTAGQRARRAVADVLVADGLVEVLSYPFVGQTDLDALGLAADDERRRALRLANPLVSSQPFMRTSVLVTLLDTARRNVSRGNGDLAVFELGLVTLPDPQAPAAPVLAGGARPAEDVLDAIRAAVPAQPRHVAGVLAGAREPAGWWGPGRRVEHGDAFEAVRSIARVLGVPIDLVATEHAPWHPGRCAQVRTTDGVVVGHAGELHPQVVAAFDLPARAVAFEVDLDRLVAAGAGVPVQARAVSTFPVAKEDIALVVDRHVPVARVLEVVRGAAGELAEEVRLFDVYTGSQVPEGTRSLAFSLRLRAGDRTLTAADAAAVRDSVVAAVSEELGGALRA